MQLSIACFGLKIVISSCYYSYVGIGISQPGWDEMKFDSPTKFLPENIKAAMETSVPEQRPATAICIFNFESSNIAVDAISSYVFSCSDVQIHTIVDRDLPDWVNDTSDVIIASYSGDSPEIDEIYAQAKTKGCRIHCITSGGNLKRLCEEDGNNLMLMPSGLASYNATGYEMGILVNLFEAMGIKGIKAAMERALPNIIGYRDGIWGSEDAWKLAVQINGRIPVIYCTGELRAVHKRWKMLINQVIGKLAFSGELPEFDHNEIVSWTEDRSSSEFVILIFKIKSGSELLDHIVSTVTDLLPEYGLDVKVIDLEGEVMERCICGIILADAVINCMKEAE